jgi:hypothetical protein
LYVCLPALIPVSYSLVLVWILVGQVYFIVINLKYSLVPGTCQKVKNKNLENEKVYKDQIVCQSIYLDIGKVERLGQTKGTLAEIV